MLSIQLVRTGNLRLVVPGGLPAIVVSLPPLVAIVVFGWQAAPDH